MAAMWKRPAAGLVLVLVAAGCGGAHKAAQTQTSTRAETQHRVTLAHVRPIRLGPVAAGNLPAPVQDAAAATVPGGAVLIGGLTAADVSTDQIVTVTRAGARVVGRLSGGAFHDSAAVSLGHLAYAFGGGNGVRQLDAIV